MGNRVTSGERVAIRDGYGQGLLDIADTHRDVVVFDADLGESTRGARFGEQYPDRWFDVGISEQDMVVMAAGIASTGKTPFAGTYASFSLRAFEQVRNVVARSDADVTIVGSHAGLATGPDGASAQAIEDIAAYRALPNMKVVSPGDTVETAAFVRELAEQSGPGYLRLVREPTPVVFDTGHNPSIGEGYCLRSGSDITLVCHGAMLGPTLRVESRLADRGIDARVVHMPTIKPLDEDLLLECARETNAVLTVEDHSVIGGLGSAVAERLAKTNSAPITRIGVSDVFGESGDVTELYEAHGLTVDTIISEAVDVHERVDST